MSTLSTNFFSSPPSSKYDLFFTGNIILRKNKIFFSKYSNILIYNSWSPDKTQNHARNIYALSSMKDWVNLHFTNYNNRNPTTILYHPTVLMQICYKNYIFVLKNATYDQKRKYKLVFDISTKEINSKVTKKIPDGAYKGIRFNIDSFDTRIDNLINTLISRPLFIKDSNHFKVERIQHTNNIRLTGFSESLVNNVNQNDVQQIEFTINNYDRIPIWDQRKIPSCAAHATCFLYTFIMGFKDVDFTEFIACAEQSPFLLLQCLTNLISDETAQWMRTRRPLTYNIIRDIIFNPDNDNFRKQNDDHDSIFSRLFPMWSAYFTPVGRIYNDNVDIEYAPSYPEIDLGTYIFSCLIGFQTWGGMPLLISNGVFTYSQFSANYSNAITNATTVAFNNAQFSRSDIDKLDVDDLNGFVTNLNKVYNPYWPIQKNSNISILTVPQNQNAIISILNQGYPITVSMSIINATETVGISLITADGLNNVLQYTDDSQKDPNIPDSWHAVIAVGYTNKSNSGNYYLKIRNSWSTKFGDNGFFYMPMSFFINDNYCSALYTAFIPGIDVINIQGVITTPITTTIYDWKNLEIGQTRVFTTNIDASSDGPLYKVGSNMSIRYVGSSLTDTITGTITAINGNNITISITNVTSNVYTPSTLFPNISANNIAGSETDITLPLGGSIGVNTIITGGECYIYSVNGDEIPHPVQISVSVGERQSFSTDLNNPPLTQIYPAGGVPTIRTPFTVKEGCFVEKTEILNIRITSINNPQFRFDNGFINGRSYSEYTGLLTGYTVPYSMGAMSIISTQS